MANPQAEREALLIQCIGVLGRGLNLLAQELERGQFAAARESVAHLQVSVEIADGLLR